MQRLIRTSLPHRRTSTNYTPSFNNSNAQTFFHKKNYRRIIQCLNEGYKVSIDIIEQMENYCELLRSFVRGLNTYSNKQRSKINNQPSISSYHTTKRAQIQTISAPEEHAQLIETRCEAIQQVIALYRRKVDRMYPRERYGLVHKHYQSDRMESLFRDAYSNLQKVSEKLEKLEEDEKTAQETVRKAKIECQNFELNETTSKKKLSEADKRLKKRQGELEAIQNTITETKDNYNHEQEIYREKATNIYQQCRALEEERLNEIREILIQFNQASHSSEYSSQLDTIYKNLLLTIESQQDTLADLNFWERAHGVSDSVEPILLETDQKHDDDNENDKNETETNDSIITEETN